MARACGRLCGRTGTSDVIDASVAMTAAQFARSEHTVVVTSDPHDITPLAAALNLDVSIQCV